MHQQAKGKLISIGGAEDKGTDLEKGYIERNRLSFFELGILKCIVDEIGGPEKKIAVITTASSIPVEVGENYIEAFGKLNCRNIDVIHVRNREDTSNSKYLDILKECNAVMFTGGNQMRLTSIFGGTEMLELIRKRYLAEENFLIAGTSAGAMAMSKTMIYEGNAGRAHLKGEVKITTGLGFIDGVIIDSHFDKRGRFGRLAQAVGANPMAIGIGLGEDTGVLIKNGQEMEAVGSGMVVIVDGHEVRYSNIADIEEGMSISIENLKVHFMSKGDRYQLANRKFSGRIVEVDNSNW